MVEVPEGDEIKYTTLIEGKSTIKAKSFAEGIKFTRQAFINDDLDALSIIPSRFVKDWDEKRGDLVWGLITANGNMPDGNALFSSDHNNLLTGAASALSEASLASALVLFKRQTALDGKRRLRVIPKFLIVPPELEVTARKLITAITASNTKDVNVFANAFIVIVEPRLTNATAWYLSADPNAIDTLYYAYLEGNETLRVNSEDDFNTDAMKYAVRGDFGTAAIDFRGLVKSNGKA
jgi:phage major head subunit gpT-like protein